MPPHLLVIDDSKAVRVLIAKALAPFACVVAEATNGFTGLFAMERTLPDLLLLDVEMPTMDGLELLTMMRSNAQLRDIPVLMMVSPTDHKNLPKITALGVNGLLKKPFTPDAAAEAVRAILPLKPARKSV